MSEPTESEIHEKLSAMPFSEFLESIPPSSLTNISDLTQKRYSQGGGISGYQLFTPEIQLHCPSDSCNGIRFFRRTTQNVPDIPDDKYHYFYISYICSNCRKTPVMDTSKKKTRAMTPTQRWNWRKVMAVTFVSVSDYKNCNSRCDTSFFCPLTSQIISLN